MKMEMLSDAVVVTETAGPDVDGSPQVRRWTMRPDQAEKHLPQFTDKAAPADARLSPGDVSAIRDAANETLKQARS